MTPLDQAEQQISAAAAQLGRVRTASARANWLLWMAVVVGSIYPLAGVTDMALQSGIPGVVAWMLDPICIFVLAAATLMVQAIVRHGEKPGAWLKVTPWLAAGATLALNTWIPLHLFDPQPVDVGSLMAHGFPPVLVISATHAAIHGQQALARISSRLSTDLEAAEASIAGLRAEAAAAEEAARGEARQRADEAARGEARQRADEAAARAAAGLAERETAERQHELAMAQVQAAAPARPHLVPPVESSRTRLTPAQLETIETDLAKRMQDPAWELDYDRLEREFSRNRRWCELRVSAARAINEQAEQATA